jgi:pimeloyl-ACP methyl ester carboxylesterase
VSVGYPALRLSVQQLAARYLPPALERCGGSDGRPVHFVTHSLGAIVLRQYLQDHPPPTGSRAVMMAPPNRGSEIADELRDLAPYRRLLGPAGQQLGTDGAALPALLEPVDIEIGIIAGRRNVTPLLGRYLPGESDGKVTVRSAALDEMKDFLVVDAGHTFIMYHPTVLRAVVRFLESGSFEGPS